MNRNWKKPPKPPPAPKPADPDAHELNGTVESIVYRNDENGYTVCRIKLDDQDQTATLVGNCSAMWEGENVKADGEWIRNKQFGYQFSAENITCIAPTSAKGIERYLASGMIRGIGKEIAGRLVRHFGDQTLRVIEKESSRLEEVEGIGHVRRKRIKESWNEQRGVRDIMIFLQGHGIGTAQSARIYRAYGQEAIALIRSNPYRLCTDVWGIGFKTADSVAMSLGIPPQSEIRARAGITHILQTLTDDGHCFCTDAELLLHGEALLEIPVETLTAGLDHELNTKRLTREENRIYLTEIYRAEVAVANQLHNLMDTGHNFRPIVADKALPWAAKRVKIDFAPSQTEALSTSLTEKVSVITGGPGVGKTTIIHALVEVFKARKLTVCLAAPTGRAAKRMQEATHHEAKTMHRLLKFQPRTGSFEFDAENPLPAHVVILDEVSMIDIRLMRDLLVALPPTAHLVLVGDIDQLPSVGPGNVLRDIINSGAIPCTALTTIFRQQRGGDIIENAHRVNRGEFIEPAASGDLSDFYFIEAETPDEVISSMLHLISDRIPKRFGFNPMSEIQVLTPMRRNQLGAENLNAVLQQALNPSGHHIERFGRHYRKGDRVMQIRNNYDKEVYNGDIGHISFVVDEANELTVDFDGRHVKYEFSELDELIHAYACSIHKSQGSEYPAVVILITTQHFKLLQRNLLYTAITRGKKLVCIVGSQKAIGMAIRNNEIQQRRTSLRERIKELIG
ncbi:MAG: ATP-dependent RecD-like DNA helicase [Verrucomicrobia bacterium]|jgi:exodeoxyribonuclease V alpha subunit|nr:ATP-dependent RecD-like DNA helicase [Verrucomicrobiota bacterium]